jgi:hypothetical protein
LLGLLARRVNDLFIALAQLHARADEMEAELATHRRLHRTVLARTQRPVRAVVTAVLAEIDRQATLVDFDEADGVYSVQIALPGEVGKALRIRARVLEQALHDPQAWRAVWNILRTAVLGIRTQRSVSDARSTLSQVRRRRG